MRNFFKKLAIRKRILLLHTNKNLMKSKKTTYYKRLATKIVADWELKVVVSRTKPCLQCDFSYKRMRACGLVHAWCELPLFRKTWIIQLYL